MHMAPSFFFESQIVKAFPFRCRSRHEIRASCSLLTLELLINLFLGRLLGFPICTFVTFSGIPRSLIVLPRWFLQIRQVQIQLFATLIYFELLFDHFLPNLHWLRLIFVPCIWHLLRLFRRSQPIPFSRLARTTTSTCVPPWISRLKLHCSSKRGPLSKQPFLLVRDPLG